MVQELTVPSNSSYFAAMAFAVIVCVAVLSVIFTILFKKKNNAVAIGGIIGFILAVVNSFAFGIVGVLFWFPFASLCRGGEKSCWGVSIVVGDIGLVLFGFLIGWIIKNIEFRK